ncbi:MAG: T9SS type A sorting domain-containing protein [Bacteroidales bacterium]|nr:T9SS type A sorting domain-containing protein [Bacteroidales bacterium]
MKKLITLYLLLLPAVASAQQLIATTGGEGSGVFWTVGEILTIPVTDSGKTHSVTPGFLQPDQLRATAIDSPAEEHSLFAYPNPVKDKLYILGKADAADWKLFDSAGRMLNAGTFSGAEQAVDFTPCPSGYYLLQVTLPKEIKLIKVIKSNSTTK